MNGETSLRQNYEQVRARIARACAANGRAATEVRLLAVSKTFPVASILELARHGQRAFGENYLQEALAKISACQRERPDIALEWHFIGPIQSNKTRPIAEHFDWVHTVDRERVARRLSEQRPPGMAPLQVCVQVNVSGEASKSGCAPHEALALAGCVASLPGLTLRGVMAIPEPLDDPAAQRARFAEVRSVFQAIRDAGLGDAGLGDAGRGDAGHSVDTLSIGMSADLDAAIAEGSTIVRIGTALFGHRPRKAP